MPRLVLQGKVVSDKGDKTVVVEVLRRFIHPLYKKIVKRSGRFMVHDPLNAHRVGDFVRIQECRPISKRKSWCIFEESVDQKAEV